MSQLDWDIYIVTGTSIDADGYPSVTVDAEGELGSVPIPLHMINGMWAMPLDPVVDPGSGEPVPSKACQVLVAWEGGVGHAFLLTDPRVMAKLPLGVPGERLLVADCGSFVRLAKDGSISFSTTSTGGGADGQSIALRVLPTGFIGFGPWGKWSYDQTGFRVTTVGGSKLSLGYAGGLVPGLGSTALLQADIVTLSGSAITIGPTGSPTQPVAQALPLTAILADIGAALSSIQAAFLLITAGSATTGGAPAAAACATAVQSATAAIAAALTTISTRTAIG